MKKLPLISVIITNYNYSEYIGQAIKSVLNQTYKNIQLIIIDDGSTDRSDKVIKKYMKQKSDIVYVRQKNMGANATRNKGIELAEGEYIFLLDADNWLDADHIEKLYKTAVEKKAAVVYTDLVHFGDDTGRLIVPEFSIDYLKINNFVDTSALILQAAIGKSRFDGWLNRRFLQDYDFFLGLGLRGLKFVKCSDASLNYRVHDKQNGHKSQSMRKLQELGENYDYIVNKYRELYPKEYNSVVVLGSKLMKDSIHLQKMNKERELQNIELIRQKDYIQHQNDELQLYITQLQASLSWKITKPLRVANYLVKKMQKSMHKVTRG